MLSGYPTQAAPTKAPARAAGPVRARPRGVWLRGRLLLRRRCINGEEAKARQQRGMPRDSEMSEMSEMRA